MSRETIAMPGAEPLLFSIEDRVATITFNRPGRLNALTRELLTALRAAVERCADDDEIRAVLITGAGRAFCAGQDLDERDPRRRAEPFDLEAIQHELFHPVILGLAALPQPVVVAVNGIAAGAGSSLALAGDIVLAARSARFVQSFVKVGLSVDAGGGWRLVRALGPARATALLMTGGALSAEDAAAAGLLAECVDDDALARRARDLAESLSRAPRTAVSAIKRAVAAAEKSANLAAYLEREAALQGEAGAHPDYREGVLAFLERREPRFE